VHVRGRVRTSGDLLQAPLTGRACVAYQVFIQAGLQHGNTTSLVRIMDVRIACPFRVEDETGAAYVEASDPFLLESFAAESRGTRFLQPHPGIHPELALFLASAGVRAKTWLGYWKTFRWTEAIVEDGSFVELSGMATREADPTGESPDLRSPPERLVLRGNGNEPLLISTATEDESEELPPKQ